MRKKAASYYMLGVWRDSRNIDTETTKSGIINRGTYFNLNRGLWEDLSALHSHCIIIQESPKLVKKMTHTPMKYGRNTWLNYAGLKIRK